MVEPDDVVQLEGCLKSGQPPVVPAFGHPVPPVERISPALSVRREVVRGDAGNDAWVAPVVEVEEFARAPYVRTDVGNEDREVSDQSDTTLCSTSTESLVLAE